MTAQRLAFIAGLCILHNALAAPDSPGDPARANATTFTFGATVYLHRWSKNGQNEFTLPDGVGVVAVYSHRVYGSEAAGPIGEWLQTNGPTIEKNLMAWDKIPSPAALKRLPQSS